MEGVWEGIDTNPCLQPPISAMTERDTEKTSVMLVDSADEVDYRSQSVPASLPFHSKLNSRLAKFILISLLFLLVNLSLAGRIIIPSPHQVLNAWAPTAPAVARDPYDLYDAQIQTLQYGLHTGRFTSVQLVKAYMKRIEEVNCQLSAVIDTNKEAVEQAASLDQMRSANPNGVGPLHGIPILIKDNIGIKFSDEGLRTSSGSYALLNSATKEDATVVRLLREAGAIILGTLNMDEFANGRGNNLPAGWSARGGQTRSPYYRNGNPCGSSSGSGVAAAVGLATVTLGTETDGSITCPASRNNVVGIKPTLGLTSRSGVIPVTEHQDSVGPLTRTVRDGAMVLSAISGILDPKDPYTFKKSIDFISVLKPDALKGARIGVPRNIMNGEYNRPDRPENKNIFPEIFAAFNESLRLMKELGATIVDPVYFETYKETVVTKHSDKNKKYVLGVDLKIGMANYLKNGTQATRVHNLSQIIEYIKWDPKERPDPQTVFNDQEKFEEAEQTNGRDEKFKETRALSLELGATRGIDKTIIRYQLDAIILPAEGFTSTPAAFAGYPIVTVPLGFFTEKTKPANITTVSGAPLYYPAPGMPFGMSFLGKNGSDAALVGYAYAYETKSRRNKRGTVQPMPGPWAMPKAQISDFPP